MDISQFTEDTLLQAVTFPHKIPDQWLIEYNAKRVKLNKELGAKVHRDVGKYSLKALAPYFLGVSPFWEEANHDSDDYVLKDVEYTYRLWEFFNKELEAIGATDFYRNHLVKWARTFCLAEVRGVCLDFPKLDQFEAEYTEMSRGAEQQLRYQWSAVYAQYEEMQREEIRQKRSLMKAHAIQKIAPSKKKDAVKAAAENADKYQRVVARYDAGTMKALSAVEELNLGSPTQLKWVLKDALGLDISDFHGEDTTDKGVLQALFDKGEDQLGPLLEYRTAQKITGSYFPGYRRMQYMGNIHASFNLDIARTGRTSSSDPNFQNISKKIQSVFKARPGYKFAYADVSAVEPRLIAYLTECPELCKIFTTGTDFHSENVRVMMGIQKTDKEIKEGHKAEREFIKEFGLSLMYGARAKRIEQSALKRRFPRSPGQCEEDYEAFRWKYKAVFEYKKDLEDRIKAGDIIYNMFGRPLNFEGTNLNMTSLNTLVQSAGSDILLESWSNAVQECRSSGLEAHPIGTIHDAGIIELPEEHAEQGLLILQKNISSWKLPTKYGEIPVLSDGWIKDHL